MSGLALRPGELQQARKPGQEAGDHKGVHLVPGDRNPGESCRFLVTTDGIKVATETGVPGHAGSISRAPIEPREPPQGNPRLAVKVPYRRPASAIPGDRPKCTG